MMVGGDNESGTQLVDCGVEDAMKLSISVPTASHPHNGRSRSGSSVLVCCCGIVVEIWEFTGSRWMAAVLVALTAWRQRGASRTPLNLQCEHN